MNTLNSYPAEFDKTLNEDIVVACDITGQVIFNYGPPFWRLGLTDHYYEFHAGGDRRRKAAEAIVAVASTLEINPGQHFFRVRLNAEIDEHITDASAFDPPPAHLRNAHGRWDDDGFRFSMSQMI